MRIPMQKSFSVGRTDPVKARRSTVPGVYGFGHVEEVVVIAVVVVAAAVLLGFGHVEVVVVAVVVVVVCVS